MPIKVRQGLGDASSRLHQQYSAAVQASELRTWARLGARTCLWQAAGLGARAVAAPHGFKTTRI